MATEAPNGNASNATTRKPIIPTGALDSFTHEDVTPTIGREYPDLDILKDILNAPEPQAEERLRELAYIISSRGVVFFRKQDLLSNELQKDFIQRLGLASGKPVDSTLHIHPILNDTSEFGVGDPQISHISSTQREEFLKHLQSKTKADKYQYRAAEWHSDVQFERVPPDYTSLRLTQLPSNGGDTLWASGYEIYDRLSEAYGRFLEGLTATFSGEGYLKMKNVQVYEGARGHPHNTAMKSVHPVVRTNPVTGWKSVFAIGPFPERINELTGLESREVLEKLMRMITEMHDLTVRWKWRNRNDLAVWDNRSVFHTPTFDYEGLGERYGNRVVGIGEEPFFDPQSKSRTEDLEAQARASNCG